jgi:hypothetical protein
MTQFFCLRISFSVSSLLMLFKIWEENHLWVPGFQCQLHLQLCTNYLASSYLGLLMFKMQISHWAVMRVKLVNVGTGPEAVCALLAVTCWYHYCYPSFSSCLTSGNFVLWASVSFLNMKNKKGTPTLQEFSGHHSQTYIEQLLPRLWCLKH